MNILCAGAAQGLVKALQGVFLEFTGSRIEARYGSGGAMRDAFLGEEPCDVLILPEPMVGELQAAGRLLQGSAGTLGRVRTGIAIRSDARRPDLSTSAALKNCLLAASAVYCSDLYRSTAGIHFASVMRELGIAEQLKPRLRSKQSGTEAMQAMAAEALAGAVGCVQLTQIHFTPGISLAGVLPREFELATVYSVAVSANAGQPEPARRFVELIAGARTRVMRQQVGFEPVAVPAAAPA